MACMIHVILFALVSFTGALKDVDDQLHQQMANSVTPSGQPSSIQDRIAKLNAAGLQGNKVKAPASLKRGARNTARSPRKTAKRDTQHEDPSLCGSAKERWCRTATIPTFENAVVAVAPDETFLTSEDWDGRKLLKPCVESATEMSADEGMSLIAYTRNRAVYTQLESPCSAEPTTHIQVFENNRMVSKPFQDNFKKKACLYSRLLESALSKLPSLANLVTWRKHRNPFTMQSTSHDQFEDVVVPPESEITVYRGEPGVHDGGDEDKRRNFRAPNVTVGDCLDFNYFASTSLDAGVAGRFVGHELGEVNGQTALTGSFGVVYKFSLARTSRARKIQECSGIEAEAEVLIPPGSRFRVERIASIASEGGAEQLLEGLRAIESSSELEAGKGDITVIHLREI